MVLWIWVEHLEYYIVLRQTMHISKAYLGDMDLCVCYYKTKRNHCTTEQPPFQSWSTVAVRGIFGCSLLRWFG